MLSIVTVLCRIDGFTSVWWFNYYLSNLCYCFHWNDPGLFISHTKNDCDVQRFCDLWQQSGFVEEKSVIIHMGVASHKRWCVCYNGKSFPLSTKRTWCLIWCQSCVVHRGRARESESKIQFPFIRSFLSKSLSLPTFLLTVVVSRTEVLGAVDKWSYFNTGH